MRLLSLLFVTSALPLHAALTITMNPFNDACGNGTGWIYAIVSGGQAPYTYAWSPAPPTGQGTNTARELVAGTYTLTVTDNMGTVVSDSRTIVSVPTLLPGNGNTGSAISCDGACNGFGSATTFALAWGGLAPYTASILPGGNASLVGSNGVQFSGLCPGTTYTCTVTDANGCTSTINNIEVTDLDTPVLLNTVVAPSCPGGQTGSAVLTFDQVGSAGAYTWPSGLWMSYEVIGNQVFMNNLAPGTYGLEAYPFDPAGTWGGPLSMGQCGMNTSVTIPVTTDPCGLVSGTVYVDLNGDCVQDVSDVPYPWRMVHCEPGGHYAMTNSAGTYNEELPYGAFTADLADPGAHAPLCPAALPAPFTLDAITPNVPLDLALQPLYAADMEALVIAGAPRPGFPFAYHLRMLNNGAFPFGPFSATLNYDAQLTYTSSSVAPAVNTPGLLQFNVPSLPSFGQVDITVVLQVPANPALIGTNMNASLVLVPAPADADPANDTYALSTLVVGAYDPNDKLVLTSSRSSRTEYLLNADSALDYTIRFQNTGNAEALHVRLVDTLAHTLDIGTLRLLGATHHFEAQLESDSILIIDFPNIMLPDSTSDLIGSQGSFSFRISPRGGMLPGAILANKADIYFDFNPPIRTNTATLITEFSTGLATASTRSGMVVAPSPAVDRLRVVLPELGTGSWSMQDAHGRLVNSGNWNGHQMLLPVDQLAGGLYVLTVHDQHGRYVARFQKE
ncbi:MAG TPA: SprB repeat-containing protein [Flavobacteriales bacterium]|nr:SprB repeat-containing protein [Flavobacteriales bacterium]